MRLKIFLIMFMFILALTFVSSEVYLTQDTLGVFTTNQDLELVQLCDNRTDVCDTCNFTSIKYPNSSIIVSNVQLTKRVADFNYTLTKPNTLAIGQYTAEGICTAGNEVKVWSYFFVINKTGNVLSTAGAILYVIFLAAALLMFLMAFYFAIRIPWGNQRNADEQIISVNDWRFVKIFLIYIDYVMLMFIFGVLYNITDSFLFLNSASLFFYWLFWILLSFLWPITVLSFILALIVFLWDKNLQKQLTRGLPTE